MGRQGLERDLVDAAVYGRAAQRFRDAKIRMPTFAQLADPGYGRHVLGAGVDHLLELTRTDRDRIFNLGYFTWVEQQGIPLTEFEARRAQAWWRDLRSLLPVWDAMIDEFNGRTGVSATQ